MTRQRNMEHSWQVGLRDGVLPRGTSHHYARLDDDIVREMRSRASLGETIEALAVEFLVSWTTASSAIKRRTWRHVA